MWENKQVLFQEIIKTEIVLFTKISVIIPHSLHKHCLFILGDERGKVEKKLFLSPCRLLLY